MSSIAGKDVQEKTRTILGWSNNNFVNTLQQTPQCYATTSKRKTSEQRYHPYSHTYCKSFNTSNSYNDVSQLTSKCETPMSSPASSLSYYKSSSISNEPKRQTIIPACQYSDNPFRQLVDSVSRNLEYEELDRQCFQFLPRTGAYHYANQFPLRTLSISESTEELMPADLIHIDTTAFRELIFATPVYPLSMNSNQST